MAQHLHWQCMVTFHAEWMSGIQPAFSFSCICWPQQPLSTVLWHL